MDCFLFLWGKGGKVYFYQIEGLRKYTEKLKKDQVLGNDRINLELMNEDMGNWTWEGLTLFLTTNVCIKMDLEKLMVEINVEEKWLSIYNIGPGITPAESFTRL